MSDTTVDEIADEIVGDGPRLYLVVSPEYGVRVPILDDGTGPTEWGCDAMYVRASTKREAVSTAVRMWVKGEDPAWKKSWGRPPRTYCQRQRDDGCSPWTGVRAEDITPEPEETP